MRIMSEPKQAKPIAASQLKMLADELHDLSVRLGKAADVAKTQEGQVLSMFNWPSVPKAMQSLRNFVAKADESRGLATYGKPIIPGTLKVRSTAKPKSIDQSLPVDRSNV
jgi:hypothetical protein